MPKCALFTPDEKTAKYCDIELNDYQKSLKGDADAVYVRTLTYRAEDFVPVMACPSQVDKIRDVSTLEGTPIDQVFIGSCTNGRLEDLAAAAEVLKGQKVADYVKLIVTPAAVRFTNRLWILASWKHWQKPEPSLPIRAVVFAAVEQAVSCLMVNV